MKEAFGGISLFQIVIVFLLLFTGIMCLTINHSKAFGVKDEIINILENDDLASAENLTDNVINDQTIENIRNYLNESGYRITGACPNEEGWVGYSRISGTSSNDAAFCIRPVNVSNIYYNDLISKCGSNDCIVTTDDFPSMVYYEIIVFYQLDIPVIKSIMNFQLNGTTKILFG